MDVEAERQVRARPLAVDDDVVGVSISMSEAVLCRSKRRTSPILAWAAAFAVFDLWKRASGTGIFAASSVECLPA